MGGTTPPTRLPERRLTDPLAGEADGHPGPSIIQGPQRGGPRGTPRQGGPDLGNEAAGRGAACINPETFS